MQEFYDVPAVFTAKRNKQKLLLSLRGILWGLTADRRLNETEILFLATWLKSTPELNRDLDFQAIQKAVEGVLEDGIITADEKDELYALLQTVFRDADDNKKPQDIDGVVNLLLGFLQGISADNQLLDKEIGLLAHIVATDAASLTWPGNLLNKRLQRIIEEGHISDEDRGELLDLIKQITGENFTETGLAVGMSTTFFANDDVMSINGKRVCFTGKFFSNTRFNLEQQAKALGAEPVKSMTKMVNVLIIGGLASRDWMFTSHGRKIEAAIKAKNEGYNIQIINEEDWVRIASEPL
ncbi:BRCT domain-containing protein [Aeromonas veronii]|uniref:BRCT domain-containing protein n=1 Tax=Aeromonas veronii TaxID=654 RepID=UPI00222EFFD2|nr:BRCT domain-containing protein [Aeromonas veronii]EKP0300558.1 BRCT domain-containing protein [Aeromonas veronii]UZE58138.1 BRCT domain-containing protein [Aeromonas veronii]